MPLPPAQLARRNAVSVGLRAIISLPGFFSSAKVRPGHSRQHNIRGQFPMSVVWLALRLGLGYLIGLAMMVVTGHDASHVSFRCQWCDGDGAGHS